MSDANEVVVAEKNRVVVLTSPGSTPADDEIVALLTACDVDPEAVTFVDPCETENLEDLEGVPVIVAIDQNTCDAPELEQGARSCAQAGGSVIVVFGDGFQFDGLHPIAADYGTQCGWSPEQLGPRLKADPDCAPLTPSGDPVDRSAARPVKCG